MCWEKTHGHMQPPDRPPQQYLDCTGGRLPNHCTTAACYPLGLKHECGDTFSPTCQGFFMNKLYLSRLSPNNSSPSSSSASAASSLGSPSSSESSSKGGKSLFGLDVTGSPRLALLDLEDREGLVAVEKGSEETGSCNILTEHK